MLVHRLPWWPNIKSTLVQSIMFAGKGKANKHTVDHVTNDSIALTKTET